jgi:hypothetical protein
MYQNIVTHCYKVQKITIGMKYIIQGTIWKPIKTPENSTEFSHELNIGTK